MQENAKPHVLKTKDVLKMKVYREIAHIAAVMRSVENCDILYCIIVTWSNVGSLKLTVFDTLTTQL